MGLRLAVNTTYFSWGIVKSNLPKDRSALQSRERPHGDTAVYPPDNRFLEKWENLKAPAGAWELRELLTA